MPFALLSRPHSNPKVAKNIGIGVLTAPLHLAPHRLSGYNVCPMATKGCIKACLHTSGNPTHMAGKSRARLRRTKLFFNDRASFMDALVRDVAKLEKQAMKHGLKCGVRLNATSDIRWETVPCVRDGATYPNIMLAFPDVIFYDYTKIANRRGLPSNYSLTFSRAENNDSQALIALANGHNVAVVVAVPRSHDVPQFVRIGGMDVPAIDGDKHDFRPADPRGVVVAVRAKGKAKHDKSGFVVREFY